MKSFPRRKYSASSRTRQTASSSAPRIVAGLGALLLPLLASSAQAASATWDGGAGTADLNTATNWNPDGVPNANLDVASFDNTTSLGTLTWSGSFGPTSGSTGGTAINYTGSNNLTLSGSAGALFGLGNITIANGAGALTLGNGSSGAIFVFRGASNQATYTNNSATSAVVASDVLWRAGGGSAKTITFAGSGNWSFNSAFRIDASQGQSDLALIKNGAGTVTFNAPNNLGGSLGGITLNQGTLQLASTASLGTGGTYAQAIALNGGALAYGSSASQTLTGIVSGTGTLSQSSGNLTLTAANTYSGATTINGGTLTVSGTGAINSTSGIAINGASAKYVHTSSVASTRTITVTQGTLDGTGTVGAVTVGNGTGGVIANGNGASSSLTLGSLSFLGAGALSVREDGNTSTSGIVVSGALSTTPANGQVTVNASQLSWNNGVVYNLLSFGSFSGSLTDFTQGTISGLTSRQSSSLVLNGSAIGLSIVGDTPKWTGADSGSWAVGGTGSNGNWRLITAGTATNYIEGDVVLFDDSASTTAVSLASANVSPSVVNFSNSTKNYTLGGAFGIAAGTLNKSGSGTVTISTANTYAGGTNISDGTLVLSGSGNLGSTSGALALTGGALDLGGTSLTTGATTLGGAATISNGTLTASSLTATNASGNALVSANLSGAGGVTKTGAGTLTLAGTNSYTGATAINGGTLALSGSGSLGATSALTLGGGSLDLGGSSQSTNAVTVSAPTTGATISNGTLSPASLTVTATSGTVGISANIAGSTGLTVSGGGTTVALGGNNTFTGNVTLASNSAITVTGGSNTGGGTLAYNSFGTTFTMAGGSYIAAGVTSSGNSDFRQFNLNGGVFRSNGNVFASGAAIATVFNGGTFRVGNAAGVTLYDSNNTVEVLSGGATIDTSLGSLSIGTNSSSANPVSIAISGGGALNITGGNALVSRITGNGAISLLDGSAWNLNGSINNAAASLTLGNGATLRLDISGVAANNATGLVTLSGLFGEDLDGGSYSVDFGGFNFSTSGSYKLIGYSSVSGSFASGDFLAANASFGPGLAGSFLVGANDLSFVVSSIPEPSAWAALSGLVVLAAAATRRRRVR